MDSSNNPHTSANGVRSVSRLMLMVVSSPRPDKWGQSKNYICHDNSTLAILINAVYIVFTLTPIMTGVIEKLTQHLFCLFDARQLS